MAIHLDLRENFGDAAVFADDEGRTRYAHIGFAVIHFLSPNAISLEYIFRGVGDQIKFQSKFFNKLLMYS